jgi:hypothetical protein
LSALALSLAQQRSQHVELVHQNQPQPLLLM